LKCCCQVATTSQREIRVVQTAKGLIISTPSYIYIRMGGQDMDITVVLLIGNDS
jgi:hypothetical protein